jgi:hypothetical protein
MTEAILSEISFREARCFAIAAIGKEPVESYAKRKGMTVEVAGGIFRKRGINS